MFGFESKDDFFVFPIFLQKCMMKQTCMSFATNSGANAPISQSKNGNTANEQQCTHCKGKWNHNCAKKTSRKQKIQRSCATKPRKKITQFSRGPGYGGGKPRILEYIYIFFVSSKSCLDFFKGSSPKSLRILFFFVFLCFFKSFFLKGALPKESQNIDFVKNTISRKTWWNAIFMQQMHWNDEMGVLGGGDHTYIHYIYICIIYIYILYVCMYVLYCIVM